LRETQRIKEFLDQYLITVQKPGRYVGGEFNQIVKNWDNTDVHTALAFPDIYDIGFSNLGIAILYDIINKREDSLAERVYAPWFDMDRLLNDNAIPRAIRAIPIQEVIPIPTKIKSAEGSTSTDQLRIFVEVPLLPAGVPTTATAIYTAPQSWQTPR